MLMLLVPGLVSTGCASRNPYFDPSKPHHTESGFRINGALTIDKSFADLIRWRWNAWRNDLPPPLSMHRSQWPFALAKPDFKLLEQAARKPDTGEPSRAGSRAPVTATRIGHATVLFQIDGKTILTAESLRMLSDLRAQEAMAIHWGTFELADEPLDQPLADLAAALATSDVDARRFNIYQHGETRRIRSE